MIRGGNVDAHSDLMIAFVFPPSSPRGYVCQILAAFDRVLSWSSGCEKLVLGAP